MRFRIAAALLAVLSCSAASAAHRSSSAKHHFRQQHPCPTNPSPSGRCPGYVIDHVVPLACGGADDPSNMQWQTTAAAKAKDRWERKGCSKTH